MAELKSSEFWVPLVEENRPGKEPKRLLLATAETLFKFWLIERRETTDEEVLLPPFGGEDPGTFEGKEACCWLRGWGERTGELSAGSPDVTWVRGFKPLEAAFINDSSLTRFWLMNMSKALCGLKLPTLTIRFYSFSPCRIVFVIPITFIVTFIFLYIHHCGKFVCLSFGSCLAHLVDLTVWNQELKLFVIWKRAASLSGVLFWFAIMRWVN